MSDTQRPVAPRWLSWAIAALAGVALGAGAMLFVEGRQDRVAVGEAVHDYLLEHPEVLREASQRLQERELAQAVTQHRRDIETPFRGAWAGNPQGDVTLVEFFDYACPYCRTSNPVVDRLIAEDPHLRVVWRELPVLGPASQQAALASLAAAEQGKYRQFHDRMFALGRPSDATIAQTEREIGLQPGADAAAYTAEISRNLDIANAIRATGTPTFVVGDQVLGGAVGYEALKQAIHEARQRA